MKEIWNKLRQWTRLSVATARCKLGAWESRLDEMPSHPVIGGGVVLLGVFVFLAGFSMMLSPALGIISISLGITLIVIGFIFAQEKHDPNRRLYEMEAARRRLVTKRREKARVEGKSKIEAHAITGEPDPDEFKQYWN